MQDVLHLPGLEEPSAHNSRSVCRGRRPVGPGGIRCRIQAGSMGAIPPHRGGRDRSGLSANTLRKHYGQYRGKVKGEPPGTPCTIRIPHTKGTTPDREVVPAESEFAGSKQEGSDQEEGEITQTEGEGSGTFTQMRPRDSDSGSDETTPGRESWRSARGQELVVLSTPRPRGRGKRRPERREGAAKRPRVESSSSDRRDGSEESRSGGGRDRPGRCSQRAAGPSTPPRRPIPASVSPRRSPRLTKSAVQGLRSLPLTTKGGRRTAHSRSVSGDERGQGPSRSSLSSSDHGRSSQGRRSRSREPTPPQLRNFDIGDFIVVSDTTDSFTFASQHHFFPGWVRVVSAHTRDRVRGIPCDHDAEEERRVKQRVRRDVEPPEVRRFLRQKLLTKVGHSWWNGHEGTSSGQLSFPDSAGSPLLIASPTRAVQICDISCRRHHGSCRKSRGKSCSAVVTMDRWSTEQQSRLHRGNHVLRSSGIRSFRRSLGTRSWIQGIFSHGFRW